jgi:menaquinone-dependent protoporphyrinogen IX oxidase
MATITLEIPEELKQKAEERATAEGETLNEAIIKLLKDFVVEASAYYPGFKKPKAKFMKISEVNLSYRPTAQEVQESLAALDRLTEVGKEIGKYWQEGVSAVDAIREDRGRLD